MTFQETEQTHIASDAPKTGTRGLIAFGAGAFFLLFCFGGVWLANAPLAGAVIAQGRIAVEGKPKDVQHLDGGIVDAIAVSDGQFVEKGALVMRLDRTAAATNVDILRSRLWEAIARKARLQAESRGLARIAWAEMDGVAAEIRSAQEALFEARLKTRQVERHQMHRKIAQLDSQIDGIRAQRLASVKQKQLHSEELAAMQTLEEQGHASKASLRTLYKQIASFDGAIGEADADEAQTEAAISETQIAIVQADRVFAEQAMRELADTEAEIREVTQQLQAAEKQLDRTEIRAPASGLVHGLSVATVGGVIAAGASVMQIVPQDKALKIDAVIDPRYIDEVRAGQSAAVRLTAMNQRTTPEVAGRVETVSATTVIDETGGAANYRAVIAIDDVRAAGLDASALVPGMPVEVFLKTQERTALSYLVKPAVDQMSRAMREQ